MKSGCLFFCLMLIGSLGLVAASGQELVQNPGFEEEGSVGQATNWWYYGEAGRADWAARSGAAGNAFYAAGNSFGGFGQDIVLDWNRGRVFSFSFYAKAELNYTNTNTTVGIEFKAGTKLVVSCHYTDGQIPTGTVAGTCQWDDFSLLQSPLARTEILEKFEPVQGVYLGVLLKQGGTAEDVSQFNQKAGKQHAVFAKFVVLNSDPFPKDWIDMVKSNCPGAGVHLVLEPLLKEQFEDFYTTNWHTGHATYDAAFSFVTNCAAAELPIFLRFAHEANGYWYPWHPYYSETANGGGGQPDSVTDETYIQGWRNFAEMVHSNASNVAMVWAPNQGNGPFLLPDYGRTYPGDVYVDWVGLSVYNGDWYGNSNWISNRQFQKAIERGYWQDNANPDDDTFENFYWEFSDPDNPAGHRKPMMIAETGAQFSPSFEMSNMVQIADFESMDGPVFSNTQMLAQFQDLNSDGLLATNHFLLEGFENIADWWGTPWGSLTTWSNTASCVQGTNAFRLGGHPGSGTWIGGNGRDERSFTNWTAYDGIELWVRMASVSNVFPSLSIRMRSINPTSDIHYADASLTATSTSYVPVRIRFSDMDLTGSHDWSKITTLSLSLNSTESGERPADLMVDRWSLVNLTNALYQDQNWGAPWVDVADTNGGTFSWGLVTNLFSGYPDQSLKMGGTDANTNFYIGGNSFNTRMEDIDWSQASSMALLARRGDTNQAEPLLSISIKDASGLHTAQVSQVVVTTNYVKLLIPFEDMNGAGSMQWTNIESVVFELLSGTAGDVPSDLYIKQFEIGTTTHDDEQDWWPQGPGFAAGGDITWSQTTDAAVGTYALQMSGVITNTIDQWYMGGNGCSLAVPEQDWSDSSALSVYVKKGAGTNVPPKLKITIDNDYTETNENEAVYEARLDNADYRNVVFDFADFELGCNFVWTNVRMLKLEMFTSQGGKQPNDIFMDQLQRVAATVTNNQDNISWKRDWIEQLYSLSNRIVGDPSIPPSEPDFVSIQERFRNVHMINWFHIRKFEDGMTKDLGLTEESTNTIAYTTYNQHIQNAYFLSEIVTDTNENNLPDNWEAEYFDGVPDVDPSADADQDGMSNWQEFIAGTDPTNQTSELSMGSGIASEVGGTNVFVIEWSSQDGRRYTIESTTNLHDPFTGVASNLMANPPMNAFTANVSNIKACMYRIRVVP